MEAQVSTEIPSQDVGIPPTSCEQTTTRDRSPTDPARVPAHTARSSRPGFAGRKREVALASPLAGLTEGDLEVMARIRRALAPVILDLALTEIEILRSRGGVL